MCVSWFVLFNQISFLQYPDGLSSPRYEYEWSMCGSDCAQEICRRLRQVNELGARVGIKQEEALRALQTGHPHTDVQLLHCRVSVVIHSHTFCNQLHPSISSPFPWNCTECCPFDVTNNGADLILMEWWATLISRPLKPTFWYSIPAIMSVYDIHRLRKDSSGIRSFFDTLFYR